MSPVQCQALYFEMTESVLIERLVLDLDLNLVLVFALVLDFVYALVLDLNLDLLVYGLGL